MLALSQTTGYAILALSCLEGAGGEWVVAKEIANCTGIPRPYLSKLLHALTGSDLIVAKRGYQGGFRLTRAAGQISLLDVTEAVDGSAWISGCLLGLEECSDQRACPTHGFWKEQRARIKAELAGLTLRDVAEFERGRGKRLTDCSKATD